MPKACNFIKKRLWHSIMCVCILSDWFWNVDGSTHRRCSVRTGVLRNVAKFTGKHLCQSLFFNKVAGLQVFSCEFRDISNNKFFTEYLRLLLLSHIYDIHSDIDFIFKKIGVFLTKFWHSNQRFRRYPYA